MGKAEEMQTCQVEKRIYSYFLANKKSSFYQKLDKASAKREQLLTWEIR